MDYINAFWVGGLICALVQILMEKTKMMPGRIMVLLVCTGAVLGAVGVYIMVSLKEGMPAVQLFSFPDSAPPESPAALCSGFVRSIMVLRVRKQEHLCTKMRV